MNDRLLKELASLDREQQREIDPQLDELVEGQLDDAARAELEKRVGKEAVEAFTPLGEDAKERIAGAALAAFEKKSAEGSGTGSSGASNVVDLGARRRRAMISGLFVLAAAAAFLMMFLKPSVAPLPKYALEVSAGDKLLRSDGAPSPEVPKFARDSRIEVILRPATALDAAVEARAFYVDASGAHALDARFESAPGGALRYAGRISELLPGVSGEIELGFIVGRAGALPSLEEARRDPSAVMSRRLRVE